MLVHPDFRKDATMGNKMKIVSNTLDFELDTDTAVAIGKFDGLHVGHRSLLKEILAKKEQGLSACVLTFDPSPAVFFGFSDGKELTTREEKRRLLERLGVDILVEFPMTKETASMPAELFVKEILSKRMHTKWIVAGTDVSFGDKGAGNEELLRWLSKELGYGVTTIDKLKLEETEASSSYVRSLIENGDMEGARRFLGMPYTIMGTVEHGRKLGRKLGMPTVNLIPTGGKLLPPNGVYYSQVIVQGEKYNAISNIGCKPTVSEENIVGIESFLYDFDQEIYGANIEVRLLAFKRSEMHFENVEQLKAQMEADIAEGRKFHISGISG